MRRDKGEKGWSHVWTMGHSHLPLTISQFGLDSMVAPRS